MMIRYGGLISILLAALAIVSGLWLATCSRPAAVLRSGGVEPAAGERAHTPEKPVAEQPRSAPRPVSQADPTANWSTHPMRVESNRLTAIGRTAEETFPGDYLSVPLDELYDMRPAKGLVTPLRPEDITAIPAAQVTDLPDDTLVLGVRVHDSVRAYPRNLAAYHVAINDIFSQTPVLVCFDAVSGACMAYRRPGAAGSAPIFAASGAGFRATGLLYDLGTESLWSILGGGWVSAHPGRAAGEQYLTGRPIAGPMVNSYPVLEPLPGSLMTWAAWRARHPRTTIAQVQTDTGNDYTIDPYTSVVDRDGQVVDYYTAPDLVLAPEGSGGDAGSLADKAWVLGIALPRGAVAVAEQQAFEAAGDSATTFELNATGGALHLHVDPAAHSITAVAGGGVVPPQVRLFWVAWRSQFPDTRVWSVEAGAGHAPAGPSE